MAKRAYDAVADPSLEAIIAFGFMAQAAVALWVNRPNVVLKEIPHPSNPEEEEKELLAAWRAAVSELRGIVTPDADNAGPNCGSEFEESDYAPIPRPRPAIGP